MTISSTTRKAGPYAGNDVTTQFGFSFKVFSSADVLVVKTDPAGAETNLSLTTHYTVSLNADQDANPGGTVTLLSALGAGYKLTLSSDVQNTQGVQIPNQGGFQPAVLNAALDKLTILVQQLAEKVGRSVKVGISSSTNPDQMLADINALVVSSGESAAAASASAAAAEQSAIDAATAPIAAPTHAATSKATPVDADELPLIDSAGSWALKKLTWANLKAGIFSAWGALINSGTSKATPADSDAFAIMDSAASNATKTLSIANLKTAIKAYLESVGLSVSASVGLGYGTGSGGTVTQATSKTTAVTLNKPTGQITMNNAALAAGVQANFTFNNSFIAATDVVLVTVNFPGTGNDYNVWPYVTSAGSCTISIKNIGSVSRSDAVVLNFVIIKGVAA